ncbi:MAG: LD-carboxypeptidase [Candidatus Gastranaerophilales bacterium]|nr:LD-carboxypeptidase [Candidatus Gastranaerophilales bacterium]
MNLIKPEKLNKGDTIGILALSGVIESKENIFRAKKYFENKGYKVVLSENIFDKNRYLAGTDEKKVQELHRFFQDPEINAILCARGGYGAIRLLDKIDFEIIKNNPKIFAGYSDVTAIEAMIYKKTGMITFYSPMAQSDFGVENVLKFVEKGFFDTLTDTKNLKISPCKRRTKTYFSGQAKGILWGGNLATVVSMCGLDFIPDEKFIFFTEDLNEDVYKIDKMFTQLMNIEKFRKNLQGIILGDFFGIGNKKHLNELFFEIGEKIKKPILSGFKITHATEKITLPYGAIASFSTEDKILDVESYLKC